MKNVYDLEFQGQTFKIHYFNIFDASKLLESIQRSNVYNQRYERSYTNVFDLYLLQGQPSRSGD